MKTENDRGSQKPGKKGNAPTPTPAPGDVISDGGMGGSRPDLTDSPFGPLPTPPKVAK